MAFKILFRWLRRIIVAAFVVAFALLGILMLRPSPQDAPWTALRLDQPIGLFTGRKLVQLADSPATCAALLRDAGLKVSVLPPHGTEQCEVGNAVRLRPSQEMLALSPASVAPVCPVMAGLLLWQTQVLQPLAQRAFGASIVRIENLGSYSCRRLYGRASGNYSEHSTANAIDVSGFVLSDGRRVSVQKDWSDNDAKGRFLHAARDGACRIFSTVLSPDYNAAHRDHLHIDLANRGETGWRACR